MPEDKREDAEDLAKAEVLDITATIGAAEGARQRLQAKISNVASKPEELTLG